VTVALVNNMPDAAFVDTEDQFRRALTAGAGGARIDLRLYAIREVPRSEATAALIQERYSALEELFEEAPDALIVTGTEPLQATLPYEPYWASLARLLKWAAESVPTTLLSCLAAHASVLLFDGIERRALRVKVSGVYSGIVHRPGRPAHGGSTRDRPVCLTHALTRFLPARCWRRVIESWWTPSAILVAGPLLAGCAANPCLSYARVTPNTARSACCASTGATCVGTSLDVGSSLTRAFLMAIYPRTPRSACWLFARLAADARWTRVSCGMPFRTMKLLLGSRNSWSMASTRLYSNWLAEVGPRRQLHAEPLV